MPGSGDSVQALKAGVMEIPDVIVVNKANHPLTDSMVREIRGVLALGPVTDWKVPIVEDGGDRGQGGGGAGRRRSTPTTRTSTEAGTLEERRGRNLRNEVLGLAAVRLRRELRALAARRRRACRSCSTVVRREVDPASAAEELLERRRGGADERRVLTKGDRPAGGTVGVAQQPSWRAITICCTSSVPSPMVRILASR